MRLIVRHHYALHGVSHLQRRQEKKYHYQVTTETTIANDDVTAQRPNPALKLYMYYQARKPKNSKKK